MKYKTLNIHPILYCIIAVILSAFIGFCLISLSYLINPINAKQNILQSSFSLLQEQDISPRINKTFPGSKKDNFTTSLMLNISSYSDTSKPFYYAATNPRVEYKQKNNHANLFISSFHNNTDSATIVNYHRYWHGYILILRLLINIYNLKEIRLINLFIGSILLLITLFYIYQKLGLKISLGFALTIFYLNPITMCTSIPYTNIYFISLLSIILLLKTSITPYKILLFAGILTAFFDTLTAPLAPLGLSLTILCLKNKTNIKNDLKQIIFLSIAFSFGYSFMILQKWLITSIITQNNILNEIYINLLFRMKGTPFLETGIKDFNYITTIKRNLLELQSPTSLIALAIYLLLVCIISLQKKEFTLNKDYKTYLLLFISSFPFIWYFIFQNHSFVHPLMSFRELSISIFALTAILSTILTNKDNK